ncbi:MAG: hypothetical protein KF884_03480 [Fimbriimonadaceae bacterium]|nr:hypothetical protein [Fimbriimonadaceae bacterium]QYK59153.1 MAG: hypothetical protein KF884_03480 [Fimbriimonadaceae bacterium]
MKKILYEGFNWAPIGIRMMVQEFLKYVAGQYRDIDDNCELDQYALDAVWTDLMRDTRARGGD